MHLGTHFGAMLPVIGLQREVEAFFSIANYRSMTSLSDAKLHRGYTLDVAFDFFACVLALHRGAFSKRSSPDR